MGLNRQLIQQLMQGYRPDRRPRDSARDSGLPSPPPSGATFSGVSEAPTAGGLAPGWELFAGRSQLVWLPLDQIESHPLQPRLDTEYQDLTELKDSLREYGQIVPAVARREGERFRLLEGHRRWYAWKEIQAEDPATPRRLLTYVIDCQPEEEAILLLAANINRREFHYFPLAHAMHEIVERGILQKDLARAIGWDPALVCRYLRLVKLPEETRHYLQRQGWPFRRINLAIDKCLRNGRDISTIRPEDLEVPSFARPKGPGAQVQATRRFLDVRLRISRPPRRTALASFIDDYCRICLEGLQQAAAELGTSFSPDELAETFRRASLEWLTRSSPGPAVQGGER
jgi:ParB/RepB/Spo0J family partition protein